MRRTPSLFSESSNPNHLTQRERQILQLLAQGLSNKAIATALCLSEKTIGTHMKSIFEKMGVHNRVAAVRAGERLGLINAGEESEPDQKEA